MIIVVFQHSLSSVLLLLLLMPLEIEKGPLKEADKTVV